VTVDFPHPEWGYCGSGYIKRERNGRRNQYTIQSTVALPDRLGRSERISDLLTILTGPQA